MQEKLLIEKTIEEVSLNGVARYNVIRQHAKKLLRDHPRKCVRCGYDKFVETCHIKGIGSFPKSTKIKVVNHVDNLILLCPNCHWKMDHGLV